MKLLTFPTKNKLELYGYCTTGIQVFLGSFTLNEGADKDQAIETTLNMIKEAKKAEEDVEVGNVLFDPTAFDWFVVKGVSNDGHQTIQ